LALACLHPGLGYGQDSTGVRVSGDSVVIRMIDTDLRAAVQAMGALLDKPLIIGMLEPSTRISFETPRPVPRSQLPALLRGLVETRGLQWSEDSLFYRVIQPNSVSQEGQRSEPGARSSTQLFVIRLRHARATDVAATVNLLFGGLGEFSGQRGLSTGTLSEQLSRTAVPPNQAEGVRPGVPPQSRAELGGSVTLVPDEITNSLLIRAAESDFQVISEAVKQLDVRPLQVLIEVLIVELRKDRSFSFGTTADWNHQNGASSYEAGFGTAMAGDIVVRFMRMARSDVSALIGAAQSRGDVDIVSRPVVLASNNTESHFMVGSQRPFVQVSRSLPTDVPSRDQVVQYRDVGTKLTVRPTINDDGYVSLLLQQEISGATDESQFGAPILSTREARTQVLVKDGQTIVIGGLRDRQRDRTSSGIPVLSSLPLVGGLFGGTRRRSIETELFLFLTPTIIRSDDDVDTITAPRIPELIKK